MEEIPLLFIVFKGTVLSGVSVVLIYVSSIANQGHQLDYLENRGKLRLVEWYVLVSFKRRLVVVYLSRMQDS